MTQSDGTLWEWGRGVSGEAGNGSTVNHSLPVQTTISSVTGIAAGDYHSLAVKSNGSVWAWGYNGSGQIGDNTTTERDSPVQVSGLSSSMTAVAAGQEFSYALKSDGTVRAWGYGGDGELGDNCWCDRHTPVEVHGVNNSGYLNGISGLGQSNGYFALAYSSTGVGYTWGMNLYGQLGDDGWRQDSGTPIQVVGLKGFSNLAGGGGHSLGITSPSRTTTTYTYDDLYRLTGAANTSRTTTYGYDPLGNRSQMVRGSTTTNYSYDESDRITQTQVVGGSTTSYTVNSAGDVTARGSDSFSYDQANRLTSATVGGTTVTFVYDGDGNLYSKTVGGTTTRYVYDVAGGMARLLDDGTRRTVWGVGLAYTLDDSGGAINVYHTDGLGSVRAQTNSSASVVATWGTDEFGVVDSALTTGTSSQQLQYTGELRDPTTSFMDLRARMYDPGTGRFMSADPLRKTEPGITGWNRYAYTGDNPTTYRDPTGLITFYISGAGGELSLGEIAFAGDFSAKAHENVIFAQTYGGSQTENVANAIRYSALPAEDPYASSLEQRVLGKINDGEIGATEKINFIGLSGGATIAFNAAELLREHAGVGIANVVFIGGYDLRKKPGNVANFSTIFTVHDPYALDSYQQYLTDFPQVTLVNDIPSHDDYFSSPANVTEVVDAAVASLR